MLSPDPTDENDERAESEGGDDRSQRRDSEIDVTVAVRALTNPVNQFSETEDARPSHDRGRRQPTERGSDTNRTSESDDYHVRIHRFEDEVVVVGDVPGVGGDELFVGLDEEFPALIVVVNETVVDHVSLPENVTTGYRGDAEKRRSARPPSTVR